MKLIKLEEVEERRDDAHFCEQFVFFLQQILKIIVDLFEKNLDREAKLVSYWTSMLCKPYGGMQCVVLY